MPPETIIPPAHLAVDESGLLIDAARLARTLCVSSSTVWRMDAAGKLPRPLRLSGGTTRWRTDDIRRWVALGCPDRLTFDASANL